jgi:hypothetical protein
VDLWSTDRRVQNPIHDSVSKRLHKFEAIGVKAGALVIDFKDSARNYFTAVDGLQFGRIHNAHATCEYGGSESEVVPVLEGRKHTIISDFAVQLELPTVEDVLKWLNLNESGSTQPYTAFADAFKNAGVDSTPITIARADRELCDRAAHWLLLPTIRPFCPEAVKRREGGTDQLITQVARTDHTTAAPAQQISGWEQLGAALGAIPNALSDLAQLVFRAGLYFLADHGYRPAKVLWWVTITLVFFWAVFLLWLKVVAFAPKIKTTPDQPPPEQQTQSGDQANLRPIGFVFLLDRLLPNYRIIDANYDIDRYFKRIPVSEAANRTPPAPIVRRLRMFEWPVEPVTSDAEKDRIENWLLWLRLLGVVFTVFLAAAIGALFVR